MKNRQVHFFFADIIRSIGIIGVIIIHSANYILYSGLYSHGMTWWFANIIRSTARVSVPLFIMLSGFLVWGVVKKQPHTVAWKKIALRLLVPLLFWYVATLFWQAFFWNNSSSAGEIVTNFWRTNITHLYYLQALIGLHLSLPLLTEIDNLLKPRKKWLVVLGLFGYSCLMTAAAKIWPHLALINAATIFSLYLGYFYLGKLCFSIQFSEKIQQLSLLVFGLFALLNASGLQNFFFNNFENLENYSAPGVVVMSVALFIFLRGGESNWKKWLIGSSEKILALVAASTYGIYLIHYIVKDIVERYILVIGQVNTGLLFYLVTNIVLVFLLSLAATILIRKNLVTKKMVGG